MVFLRGRVGVSAVKFLASILQISEHQLQVLKWKSFLWPEYCIFSIKRRGRLLKLGLTDLAFIQNEHLFGPRCLLIKDVRTNCFCASLLRTQFTLRCNAMSCVERARWWRNVEIYSTSGHLTLLTLPLFSFDRSLSLSIFYIWWKIKEELSCGSLIFSTFLPLHHQILLYIIVLHGVRKSPS